jgi:hypothetical protein
MGLQEKRALKEFQEGSYKKLIEEINSLVGYEIEFEVRWEKIALDNESAKYENSFSKIFFIPIKLAFEKIVADDMGKEALKETLKKIIITNEKNTCNNHEAYVFDGGTLTIDHLPFAYAEQVESRVDFLNSYLMKLL